MPQTSPKQLRKRAESILGHTPRGEFEPPEDLHKVVYELSVYQTELEIQNDELRRVQLELSATRDRYKALFDQAPVGYLTVDKKNLVLEANQQACKLFEKSQEELVGENLTSQISKDDMDVLFVHLRQAIRSNKVSSCEVVLNKTESELIVRLDSQRVAAATLPHNESETEEWTIRVVVTDITQAKKISQFEIETQKARQEERLTTLSSIAGSVAHDFNNLLLPITIHAEMAKTSVDIGSSPYNNLDNIIVAADAAAVLCQQLMDFTGSSQLEPKPLELRESVYSLLPILESNLPDRHILSVEHDIGDQYAAEESQCQVMADVVQLKRVLLNLVTNASEAIGSQDGKIQISVDVKTVPDYEIEKMILVENISGGKFVVLCVADNGCGISPEHLTHIFDPFYSTKFSGRGLGLASVFGIARQHGACIEVDSSPQGTEFRIYFPTIEDQVDPEDIQEDANEIVCGSGTILVVDDNSLVRISTEQLLVMAGYKVITAESGLRAIELISEQRESIDLVLLDVMMPVMDGIETLGEIRQIVADIHICMMSGFAENSALERLNDLEIDGFITKPSSVVDLTTRIRSILDSRNSN